MSRKTQLEKTAPVIIEEKTQKSEESAKRQVKKKVTFTKCKYEDKGKCKRGRDCPNIHPKGVCQ